MRIIHKTAHKTVRNLIFASLVTLLFCGAGFMAFAAAQSRDDSGIEQHTVSAPQRVMPGDPLLVSIRFTDAPKNFESAQAHVKKPNAEKNEASATFYLLPDSAGTVYFAALPLSTLLEPGSYNLIVELVARGKQYAEQYAVTVDKKEFVSETLHLDSRNTGIKTDTGPERATQIEQLFAILNTADYSQASAIPSFSLPVTSTRRTSFFGDRRIFEYSNGKSSMDLHYGIDFGVPRGTTVSSCADGTVVLAAERLTTGFSLVIEHAPGLYSLYYHLDRFIVAEGQRVKRGEQIGVSGSTGLSTGPHLHWEVRLLGAAVNPDFFVSQ